MNEEEQKEMTPEQALHLLHLKQQPGWQYIENILEDTCKELEGAARDTEPWQDKQRLQFLDMSLGGIAMQDRIQDALDQADVLINGHPDDQQEEEEADDT